MNGFSWRTFGKIIAAAMLFCTLSCILPNASAQGVLSTETSAPQLGETSVSPGTPIGISTTVVDQKGIPVSTGTVTFCQEALVNRSLLREPCGHYPLATAQVTKNGAAVSSIRLPIGAVKVVAVYAGTKNLKGSVSPSTVATVTGFYPTSTSLSYSGPVTDLTLTASVTSPSTFIPGYLSVRDLTNDQPLFSFPGPVTTSYSFHALGASVPFLLPFYAITADLDNDGYPDVINLDYQGAVSLYFNEHGKTLTRPRPLASGYYAIGVGDFNNDDIADLIFYDGSFFEIYYGKGNGNFPDRPSLQLPAQQMSSNGVIGGVLYTGDFNEDGTIDFAYDDEGQFVVVPNNGNGTFGQPIVSSDGSTLADVENGLIFVGSKDGHLDVGLPGDGAEFFYLKGHGDGTFTPTVYPSTGADISVAVTDLNQDGYDDFVLGSPPIDNPFAPDTGSLTIFYGGGEQGLQGQSNVALPHPAVDILGLPYGVLATDVLGNFMLTPAGNSPAVNFTIPNPNGGQYEGPGLPLVAAADFAASGSYGFALGTGANDIGPTALQTYTSSAISTMTIQQSAFSFKDADTLLGLYHPGGNAAFYSSDSKPLQIPAAPQ